MRGGNELKRKFHDSWFCFNILIVEVWFYSVEGHNRQNIGQANPWKQQIRRLLSIPTQSVAMNFLWVEQMRRRPNLAIQGDINYYRYQDWSQCLLSCTVESRFRREDVRAYSESEVNSWFVAMMAWVETSGFLSSTAEVTAESATNNSRLGP